MLRGKCQNPAKSDTRPAARQIFYTVICSIISLGRVQVWHYDMEQSGYHTRSPYTMYCFVP